MARVSDVGSKGGAKTGKQASLRICNKVVLPALSSPKNISFPDLFIKPRYCKLLVSQFHRNDIFEFVTNKNTHRQTHSDFEELELSLFINTKERERVYCSLLLFDFHLIYLN